MIRHLWAVMLTIAVMLTGCDQATVPAPKETPVTIVPTATIAPPAPTLPAAATPALVTPLPSPTPAPTGTPIVYVVKRGDTLLAIAIRFGVTTEAIQLANGMVDPRRLQIDQPLIIPSPEPESEEPATPTPTPPPLAVRGLRVEKTPPDTLWAMGEVFNPGTAPISEVTVGISLLDAQGSVVATETTPPQLDVIPPGRSVAFALQFAQPPPSFAQYRAEVLSGAFTSSETRYYLELAITDTRSLTASSALTRLSGSLHNTGAGDVEQVRLLATGYDDQNRVAALRQVGISPAILHPAEAVPFEVELSWVGSPVVSTSFQAQGLRVMPTKDAR